SMALMEVSWLMPLVAAIEIIGGVLFIPARSRALGAIVILPITVGVLCVHSTVAPSGLPVALFIMATNIWVIIENRRKYLPMISKYQDHYTEHIKRHFIPLYRGAGTIAAAISSGIAAVRSIPELPMVSEGGKGHPSGRFHCRYICFRRRSPYLSLIKFQTA